MFIKEGQHVPIKDLLKGIIVDSGNDACVAMAEHLGGSEDGFAQIMNQKAQDLGMKDTHFTDSTGLPNQDLYTTAKDLAILGRALITEFPEYYHWYKQKWYTYNGIRQPNRNRLLWRDNLVDGIKTGHTNEAGFCLVSSAKHDSMRLLSVVMNEPNDTLRADDSERLLNYGFRFYETHSLFKSGQAISQISLYKGQTTKISVGLQKNEYITIPTGQYARLRISTNLPPYVQAPINKGAPIGEMVIHFDNRLLATKPLYALEDAPKGGLYVRAKDSVRLLFKRMIG
jgi:D-alanyl-D-alanine carboxypeptidase (penicillin-binding protein 5/6)